MERMLYVGMSGAKETLLSQGMNNNNLANISTIGFKEDLAQQRSVSVFGPGLPTRAYALTEKAGVNFAPGPIENTGRPLDMAIKQDGWIAVQSKDGSEAYTRDGNLRITAEGLLINGVGLPVMGNGGPISIPPFESLSIAGDGTITIRPLGQAASALAIVDRIRLVNPSFAEMEKRRDGLMGLRSGEEAEPDAAVRLIPGSLEHSNANVVESMVRMISLNRNFDMQVKVMSTAEEVDKATDALMRMS
ncbi:MAG TPA: flagellar basal body rod protein FlgF [Gammaproteobacteria bacterium]|nr:flagellar basal body rod protein FlgF [Gammaproteobacteria bacterium]